jgi:hypothetical protein
MLRSDDRTAPAGRRRPELDHLLSKNLIACSADDPLELC